MARSQARKNLINQTFDSSSDSNHVSSDWHALRSSLVDLLDQVESKVSHSNVPSSPVASDAPNNSTIQQQSYTPPPYPQAEKQNSSVQPLQETNNVQNGNENLSIGSIEAESPTINNERFDNFTQTIENISTRLERFEEKLKNTKQSNDEYKQIYKQVEQLTKVIESLNENIGEAKQIKTLETQIASMSQLIENNIAPDFSFITNRLDDLSQNIEQLKKIQRNAMANPSPELTKMGAVYEVGMRYIKESVANIYDRIDRLDQSAGFSQQDIEKLFYEMGEISSKTAAISQELEDGKASKNIREVLNRIDAFSEKITLIMGDDEVLREIRHELEGLHENVRRALAPNFSQVDIQAKRTSESFNKDNDILTDIYKKLSDLTDRFSNNGADIQNNINISQSNKRSVFNEKIPNPTHSQTKKAPYPYEAPIANIDANLVEAKAKSVEEALEEIRQSFLADDIKEDIKNISDSIPHEEQAIASYNPEPESEQAPENELLLKSEPELNIRETQNEERLFSQNKINLIDKFDDFEEEETGRSLSEEIELAIKESSKEFDEQIPLQGRDHTDLQQQSPVPEEIALPINETTKASIEYENNVEKEIYSKNNNEQPAKPSSIFDDKNDATFGDSSVKQTFGEPKIDNYSPENYQQNKQINLASRNTFIEAARRAAQRQNDNVETEKESSLIEKAFSRFQNNENKGQKKVEAEQKDEQQGLEEKTNKTGINIANLLNLSRKAKKHKQTEEKATNAIDNNKQSFLSSNFRAILLAGLLVLTILLLANFIINKGNRENINATAGGSNDNSPTQVFDLAEETKNNSATAQETITKIPQEEITSPNPNAQPVIDEGTTSSINPSTYSATTAPRIIVQAPPPSLTSAPKIIEPTIATSTSLELENLKQLNSDNITTSSVGANIEEAVSETTELVKQFTPSPISLELPDEKIGPLALRQAAADGDPRAQFEVGAIYGEGKALEQDFAMAAIWYERAAAQGFAPAGLRLGGLYEVGKGVEKNLEQAKLWYQRAAEAKNRMAMHNLASIYANGALGEQKFLEAAEWFERAAKNGLTDSQFNLAMLYARGLGVKQDMQLAYFWFSIAANNGDKGAAKARDDIARSLDSSTIMQLQSKIAAFKSEKIDIKANFAPIGTWSDNFNPGKTINEKNIIEKVQVALSKLGYDVGSPDGIMGPRTKDAIKEFEKATGMSPSGAINPRLLAVLGSQPV